MKRIELEPDAKQCYRWWSMWGYGILTVLGGLWAFMPELQQYLPPALVMPIAIASAVARVIRQNYDRKV